MKLHEVEPREQKGRDTINRYRAQYRAATIESLALLENKEIERIFCDYHEDYVVKYVIDSEAKYRFVQVKTKAQLNYQYTILEVFGLKKKPKKSPKHELSNSFAGKLLLHIESFGDSCHSVEIRTNVNFDDEVESIINEIEASSALGKHTTDLITETQSMMKSLQGKSLYEVISFLSRLKIEPRHNILHEDDESFVSLASYQIFKYSEINLTPDEVRKIIVRLLSRIEEKSSGLLSPDIMEHELNALASICIDDVLDTLSITKSTYEMLRSGGDEKALKSASILQRILLRSGFSDSTVDTFAGYKCQWENWYRIHRHELPDFLMTVATELIIECARKLAWGKLTMTNLSPEVKTLHAVLVDQLGRNDLTLELVFGAVLSELVRGEAQ
ncbi:dsDNA nuclease domain-containing protein [Pseudomonas denitrificans (nom. rej.)]|uniref:DUF4297 domain-containing protein n=1 Tax=Pseudomonas denitrificans TaxID=43306 RepID=A0A9X7R6W4_PSEDE|nr:dsDNA nuclease domain-containing protein [Pseudomonas denitrificans (nom. rej.)]QEY75038.1 DUF4297 domain-containing protein [Pseudomonas denitrificans (nom. rej.)]